MPTTTNYIWDEQNYLAEADGSDTINVVYTNEPQQYGNLISTRISGTTSYHHFDALGSTRQLTNASAVKTDSWIYDAWGDSSARVGTTSVFATWIGEKGYYFDVENALTYVRRRSYSMNTARWSAIDPLHLSDRLNWYEYSSNAPLLRVDPSGEKCAVGDGFIHMPGRGAFRSLSLAPFDDSDLAWWQLPTVGSTLAAIWELRGTMIRNPADPFGSVIPDPNSPWYERKCCCCNWIGYVQVAHSVVTFGFDIPWGIDKGLPYPNSDTARPCEGVRNRIQLRDSPSATAGPLLQKLEQELETCVACLGGLEGPRWTNGDRRPLRRFVTYGCFTWAQTLVRVSDNRPGAIAGKDAPYFVRRSIEIGGHAYVEVGDTTVEVPTPIEGDPPTSDFKNALLAAPVF